MAWRNSNALCLINEVTLWRAQLLNLEGNCLQASKASRYVASNLGRLSLLSLYLSCQAK